eukprot:322873_1
MVYLSTNGPRIIHTVFSASHVWCLLLLLMGIIGILIERMSATYQMGSNAMDFKTSCGHIKIGYDTRKIQSDYAYIGRAFAETRMDTEIGYDGIKNAGFNYRGMEFGCVIKYR